MRKLLLGFLSFAFCAFLGTQALHAHPGPDSGLSGACQVCVLGSQSVREAPSAAPAPAPSEGWTLVADRLVAGPSSSFQADASARAPPAA